MREIIGGAVHTLGYIILTGTAAWLLLTYGP